MNNLIKVITICLLIVIKYEIGVLAQTGNEIINQPAGRTWADTAGALFSGPGRQFAVRIAEEMISRTAGNSQILSLNLSNLLVLFLLKALIFAAGLLGANNWSQYGRGRSADCEYTNRSPLLFLEKNIQKSVSLRKVIEFIVVAC